MRPCFREDVKKGTGKGDGGGGGGGGEKRGGVTRRARKEESCHGCRHPQDSNANWAEMICGALIYSRTARDWCE